MPVRVIKIALAGAWGRMGQEISALAKGDARFEILEPLDLRQKKPTGTLPEVVIDFSNPDGTALVSAWCGEQKIPFVTGVTGLSLAQENKLHEISTRIPVFSSPNMSVGLNGMAQALGQFAKIFPGGDVAIEDIHHRNKKDSPSGTARFLHQTVKDNINAQAVALEPVSIRAGEIFGIHKVYFFMEGEWVCFEHQAQNRSIFARGALEAASWLAHQGPGLYGMKNLLQDKAK